MLSKKYISFFLMVLFVSISFDVDAQCKMCSATAEASDYAKGLNTGILYLLLAPVLVLGGVMVVWIKNRDKFSSNEI